MRPWGGLCRCRSDANSQGAGSSQKRPLPQRGLPDRPGTVTCPAGNVTHTLRTFGTRTNRLGQTYPVQSFQFDPAVCGVCPLRSQCVAAGEGKGRTVTLHPQEALLQQARALRALPQPAAGGRASPGSAGATGGPPISLLWSGQDPLSATPGSHGGQPDPGGYQWG